MSCRHSNVDKDYSSNELHSCMGTNYNCLSLICSAVNCNNRASKQAQDIPFWVVAFEHFWLTDAQFNS